MVATHRCSEGNPVWTACKWATSRGNDTHQVAVTSFLAYGICQLLLTLTYRRHCKLLAFPGVGLGSCEEESRRAPCSYNIEAF